MPIFKLNNDNRRLIRLQTAITDSSGSCFFIDQKEKRKGRRAMCYVRAPTCTAPTETVGLRMSNKGAI
ncbi:hypothetical protein D4760_17330 [Eubacterium callanderi]|nr:hypothetical protein [Eubacterium callanderi]